MVTPTELVDLFSAPPPLAVAMISDVVPGGSSPTLARTVMYGYSIKYEANSSAASRGSLRVQVNV
jgi:hypothetical protein